MLSNVIVLVMTQQFIHQDLANGRWHNLNIEEQLANIGSEVFRAIKGRGNHHRYQGAIARALELFDFTLSDPRWKGHRLKEIARARELFCDAISDHPQYQTTLEDLDRYFTQFALLARKSRL